MIMIRSLIKETLKGQVVIFFILILIFFSQKTINILNLAVQGNIPSDLVFLLLWLGVPEMVQLLLPLSLFLSILIIYSKLYIGNEITVMHACGLGKNILLIAALILSLFTAIIAVINVVWVLPWSSKYQEQALADAKANPRLTNIVKGRFKTTKDQNLVLYIGDIKGNNFTDVFMAQLQSVNNQRSYVVIAKNGYIREDQNNNQIIVLDKGIRYECTSLLRNFSITHFQNYQAIIDYKKISVIGNKIEQMDLLQLWSATDTKSKAELHWRLTLVLSVFIMALIVVPLSKINLRHGIVLSRLPAMLLYLIFFLLQNTLHSNAEKGEIDSRITMWLVNIGFLLLALILNTWDSSFIRQLRIKFHKECT